MISTGDEIVDVERKPGPGQIRDANGHSVAALVRACGAEATRFPIVPDDESALRHTIESALEDYDVVVLSGGSSVGMRDLVVDVLAELPNIEVLAHGIAIRPGKPALFARCKGKAIVDLPGPSRLGIDCRSGVPGAPAALPAGGAARKRAAGPARRGPAGDVDALYHRP